MLSKCMKALIRKMTKFDVSKTRQDKKKTSSPRG
jgi:hypothetical protein